MQKIMFNDRYGLTEAVLEGRKTQTRRIANVLLSPFRYENGLRIQGDVLVEKTIDTLAKYKVGEVVAIARSYGSLGSWLFPYEQYGNMAGFTNKMFVSAELMINHIKITNIRVERLQDISEEDCLKEGIDRCGKKWGYWKCDKWGRNFYTFETKQKAFAHLIDKVGKKGTWDSNPYVFVYDFERLD